MKAFTVLAGLQGSVVIAVKITDHNNDVMVAAEISHIYLNELWRLLGTLWTTTATLE